MIAMAIAKTAKLLIQSVGGPSAMDCNRLYVCMYSRSCFIGQCVCMCSCTNYEPCFYVCVVRVCACGPSVYILYKA